MPCFIRSCRTDPVGLTDAVDLCCTCAGRRPHVCIRIIADMCVALISSHISCTQADDLVSALQVNLAARLDSLNLNLTVALPTLSMPVPDWLSMNGTTFNMRDILSQLPGMAGGDAE